jgi:hypothetical protein
MPLQVARVKALPAVGLHKHNPVFGIPLLEPVIISMWLCVEMHGIAEFRFLPARIVLLLVVLAGMTTMDLCAQVMQHLIHGWQQTDRLTMF